MSKEPQIKLLLFSMDGVLVDVSGSYRRAVEKTAAHFTGRNTDAGAVQRYRNLGDFSDDWKLTHAIITDAGMEIPMSRVIEEFQRVYRGESWDGLIAEETPLIETATLAVLCEENRIMGVVTGRPGAEARWTLRRFGWKQYLPLVVGCERQEHRCKLEPAALQQALTILAAAGKTIKPEETAYVGDAPEDMAAARDAGMWAIGIADDDRRAALLRAEGARIVVSGCNELPEALTRLDKKAALAAEGNL